MASGSYQKRVGQDYLSCMSQPTVSKVLKEVVHALNILMDQWIRFPITEAETQRVKEQWDLVSITIFNSTFNDNNIFFRGEFHI